MKLDDFEFIQLELKYCERCGGLWLREYGTTGIYCEPCSVEMTEVPMPRKRGPRPKFSSNHRLELVKGRPDTVCCDGGNA